MTYTNYPFNAIWAIVKLSRPSSRTFPASLTQKHQLEKSLVSKHYVDTGRSRAFVFRTGHVKIVVVSRVRVARCEGARVRRCGRRATTRGWMGARRRGEARYVSLPVSLRKSPIATVPSLNELISHYRDTLAVSIHDTPAPRGSNTTILRDITRFSLTRKSTRFFWRASDRSSGISLSIRCHLLALERRLRVRRRWSDRSEHGPDGGLGYEWIRCLALTGALA